MALRACMLLVASGLPLGLARGYFDHDQTHEAWSPVTLDCRLAPLPEAAPEVADPVYAWITPNHRVVVYPELWDEDEFKPCIPETSFVVVDDEHLSVLANGSLHIDHFGWGDRGYYQCVQVDRERGNVSRESERFYVALIHRFRNHVYYFSNLYAVTAALGFLLLTLFIKFIYFILETYGCCLCCCCCEDRLPPKAQKVKTALDSIEAYKVHQLDKLKENYTQQMQRIRDYSGGQLDKVHENYIFQRQRLRKFSAQNYLKMRATGKYTQKTLNRVMDNIPPLYLDLSTCRQGMGPRAESINLPPDFDIGDLNVELGFDDDHSLYFTPTGTPQRELPPPLSPPFPLRFDREMSPRTFHRANDPRMVKSKSLGHLQGQGWFPPLTMPIPMGVVGAGNRNPSVQRPAQSHPMRQEVQAIVEHVPKDVEPAKDLNEALANKDFESLSTVTTNTGGTANDDDQCMAIEVQSEPDVNLPDEQGSTRPKEQVQSPNQSHSQTETAFKGGSHWHNEPHTQAQENDPLLS
eukprot:maker-scaffold239_size242058-snap-gene-0.16 protein:Tk09810 transcript:maker-scaffold239_size242058-snap-gene-0.16-mRNA-1 annotation:"leucine-rich repeat and immunoglobulin-like domain-containing nogo receptor-interacting protein 2"